MKQITIGELAKKVNTTSVAIRHYEKLGLIKSKRSKAKYRIYSECDALQLIFIQNAQMAGFSLQEIKSLLILLKSKKTTSRDIKELTLVKIKEIEAKIATLKQMVKLLSTWSKACDGKVPLKKCPILQNLFKQSTIFKGKDDCCS